MGLTAALLLTDAIDIPPSVWRFMPIIVVSMDLLAKVKLSLDAGATGLIFGRNMWQRPMEDALEISKRVQEMLAGYGA